MEAFIRSNFISAWLSMSSKCQGRDSNWRIAYASSDLPSIFEGIPRTENEPREKCFSDFPPSSARSFQVQRTTWWRRYKASPNDLFMELERIGARSKNILAENGKSITFVFAILLLWISLFMEIANIRCREDFYVCRRRWLADLRLIKARLLQALEFAKFKASPPTLLGRKFRKWLFSLLTSKIPHTFCE